MQLAVMGLYSNEAALFLFYPCFILVFFLLVFPLILVIMVVVKSKNKRHDGFTFLVLST